MGFGILFIGFTLVLTMIYYPALPSFIGYGVCAFACFKLSAYEGKFKLSGVSFAAVGTAALVNSVLQIVWLLGKNDALKSFLDGAVPVFTAIFYLGQILLLPALIAIAGDTGRKKTVFACWRNGVIFILLFGLFIAANILKTNETYAPYCVIYIAVSPFIVLILNMISVFACYMWICPEGEEEREQESALNRSVTRHFGKNKAQEKETPHRKKRKKK